MRRISDLVEEMVRTTPFLEAALADGIINHSALARRLKGRIEKALLRKVSEPAVMMALRRLGPRLGRRVIRTTQSAPPLVELTVRSGLIEFTYHRSTTLRTQQRRLLTRLERFPDAFVTYTQGVTQAMLIVGASFEKVVEEVFAQERPVAVVRNLSAVVIRLTPAVVKTPGAYYQILKQLAWQNVNVVDVVSTYTELTIVIEDSQVAVAFAALRGG
jgi:aspartokinase